MFARVCVRTEAPTSDTIVTAREVPTVQHLLFPFQDLPAFALDFALGLAGCNVLAEKTPVVE